MPDSPEVQQNFNATVYGVAGKVAGDQIKLNGFYFGSPI